MSIKDTVISVKTILLKFVKWFFGVLGGAAFAMLVLSFTDIPFYAYYNLATNVPPLNGEPDLIVIPGGAGMPSPDGLIRLYYGAEAAKQFPEARIILALPYNDGADSLRQLRLMTGELLLKGVDSARIEYEPLGFNTWSQAVNISKWTGIDKGEMSILIITTPEHMYRTVKTYQKAGFVHVGGMPAFEKPVDENKLLDKEKINNINLALRYNMWSYLNYELLVMREYMAIAYYKMRGWI